MEALCKRKKDSGYVEIVVEPKYGGFDPPIGVDLDPRTKAGVVKTAGPLSLRGLPIAKPTKPQDRRKVLTDIVRGKHPGVTIVRHPQCVGVVTGRIAVTDPLLVLNAAPLRRHFEPGWYDVHGHTRADRRC